MKKIKIYVESLKKRLTKTVLKKCEAAKQFAIEHARSIHASGKPALHGDDLKLYTSEITTRFETIDVVLSNEVNSSKERLVGDFEVNNYKEKRDGFKENIRRFSEGVSNAERDERLLPLDDSAKILGFTILAGSVSLGETIVSIGALRDVGTTTIAQALLFLSLLATYIVASGAIAKWIEYAEDNLDRIKRRLSYGIILFILAVVFYSLGSLRVASLMATSIKNEVVSQSAFQFMVTNLIFLACSVALHIKIRELKSNPEVAQQRRKIKITKKEFSKKLKAEEKAYEEFKKEFPEDQKGLVALLGIIDPLHQIIVTKHNEAIQAFKSEIIARTQGPVPDCLSQEIAPLKVSDSFDVNRLT